MKGEGEYPRRQPVVGVFVLCQVGQEGLQKLIVHGVRRLSCENNATRVDAEKNPRMCMEN